MIGRTVRVMVVDDHTIVREGVVATLEREPDLEVVGTAASAEDALAALDETAPDVVILDHRLPGMTGAALCREIAERRPAVAVAMLTSFLSDEVIHECLAAGARGYLSKDVATTDLPRAVRSLARGESVLGSAVTERVIGWARQARDAHQGGEALSPHEVEILALVAQGLSNPAIGRHLYVSEATVKAHLQVAMRKLGATRRGEAVAAAIDRGVI